MKEVLERRSQVAVGLSESSGRNKDELWIRCPGCRELLYVPAHARALRVCSKCSYHCHMAARERIDMVLDGGTFRECDAPIQLTHPLAQEAAKGPRVQVSALFPREASSSDAFVYGVGSLAGQDLVIGVSDFQLAHGAAESVLGEGVTRAIELAIRCRLSLVLFSSSSGAAIQQGVSGLLQMAKTLSALNQFNAVGRPFFSVMTDPCLGHVTAGHAMLGDVNIAERGATIGFASRAAIKQTGHVQVPDRAVTAEFLQEHGMVDLVLDRAQIPRTLARLLGIYSVCRQRGHQ